MTAISHSPQSENLLSASISTEFSSGDRLLCHLAYIVIDVPSNASIFIDLRASNSYIYTSSVSQMNLDIVTVGNEGLDVVEPLLPAAQPKPSYLYLNSQHGMRFLAWDKCILACYFLVVFPLPSVFSYLANSSLSRLPMLPPLRSCYTSSPST